MKKKIENKITPKYTEKGRLSKLGIKDPSKLTLQVQKDFSNSEQTKYLWIPQRAEDLKNYYGVTPSAEWPFKGASRFKSGFQRIVVDTLSGNILKSFFAPERPIRAVPAPMATDSSNDTLANLKYVEDLHNAIQEKEYHLRQVLDKAIPTSLIESFVVLHPVYEYITRNYMDLVKRWVPKNTDVNNVSYDPDTDSVETIDSGTFVHSINLETSNMTPQELSEADMKEVEFDVDKEECVKDGVSLKMINGYRFYMPLGSPGESPYEKVQRAPYVIHQLFYTLREVQDLIDTSYFEDVDPIVTTVYDRQRELLTYIKLERAGFLLDSARLENEYVEVLKWSGRFMVNNKFRDLTVWMDRGSGQILRAEVNVYGIKPYFPLTPFPVDETPYGESLCQIIRGHVKDLDLLIRMVINTAIMRAAPPRFFDPAGGFNPSTVGNFGPNSYIPVREPSRNILQPPIADDPTAAVQMIQFIINIIERITGVNEVIQGLVADRANTTATEIQNATARSGVRFETIYNRYKEQLNPMLSYIHRLLLRNMPQEKEVYLMGKENQGRLIKIHKSQLKGAFEFYFAGGSVVEENNLLQKAITLFQTVGQHPYLTYKAESIYYMLFNIVKGLNPIAMDKILPKPEEVQKIEQQNQEAQRQQEMIAMQMQQQAQQNSPEVQKMMMELQMNREKHQMDMQKGSQDLQIKAMEAQLKLTQSQEEHSQKLKHKDEEGAQALAMQKIQAEAKLQEEADKSALRKAQAHEKAKQATKD